MGEITSINCYLELEKSIFSSDEENKGLESVYLNAVRELEPFSLLKLLPWNIFRSLRHEEMTEELLRFGLIGSVILLQKLYTNTSFGTDHLMVQMRDWPSEMQRMALVVPDFTGKLEVSSVVGYYVTVLETFGSCDLEDRDALSMLETLVVAKGNSYDRDRVDALRFMKYLYDSYLIDKNIFRGDLLTPMQHLVSFSNFLNSSDKVLSLLRLRNELLGRTLLRPRLGGHKIRESIPLGLCLEVFVGDVKVKDVSSDNIDAVWNNNEFAENIGVVQIDIEAHIDKTISMFKCDASNLRHRTEFIEMENATINRWSMGTCNDADTRVNNRRTSLCTIDTSTFVKFYVECVTRTENDETIKVTLQWLREDLEELFSYVGESVLIGVAAMLFADFFGITIPRYHEKQEIESNENIPASPFIGHFKALNIGNSWEIIEYVINCIETTDAWKCSGDLSNDEDEGSSKCSTDPLPFISSSFASFFSLKAMDNRNRLAKFPLFCIAKVVSNPFVSSHAWSPFQDFCELIREQIFAVITDNLILGQSSLGVIESIFRSVSNITGTDSESGVPIISIATLLVRNLLSRLLDNLEYHNFDRRELPQFLSTSICILNRATDEFLSIAAKYDISFGQMDHNIEYFLRGALLKLEITERPALLVIHEEAESRKLSERLPSLAFCCSVSYISNVDKEMGQTRDIQEVADHDVLNREVENTFRDIGNTLVSNITIFRKAILSHSGASTQMGGVAKDRLNCFSSRSSSTIEDILNEGRDQPEELLFRLTYTYCIGISSTLSRQEGGLHDVPDCLSTLVDRSGFLFPKEIPSSSLPYHDHNGTIITQSLIAWAIVSHGILAKISNTMKFSCIHSPIETIMRDSLLIPLFHSIIRRISMFGLDFVDGRHPIATMVLGTLAKQFRETNCVIYTANGEKEQYYLEELLPNGSSDFTPIELFMDFQDWYELYTKKMESIMSILNGTFVTESTKSVSHPLYVEPTENEPLRNFSIFCRKFISFIQGIGQMVPLVDDLTKILSFISIIGTHSKSGIAYEEMGAVIKVYMRPNASEISDLLLTHKQIAVIPIVQGLLDFWMLNPRSSPSINAMSSMNSLSPRLPRTVCGFSKAMDLVQGENVNFSLGDFSILISEVRVRILEIIMDYMEQGESIEEYFLILNEISLHMYPTRFSGVNRTGETHSGVDVRTIEIYTRIICFRQNCLGSILEPNYLMDTWLYVAHLLVDGGNGEDVAPNVETLNLLKWCLNKFPFLDIRNISEQKLVVSIILQYFPILKHGELTFAILETKIPLIFEQIQELLVEVSRYTDSTDTFPIVNSDIICDSFVNYLTSLLVKYEFPSDSYRQTGYRRGIRLPREISRRITPRGMLHLHLSSMEISDENISGGQLSSLVASFLDNEEVKNFHQKTTCISAVTFENLIGDCLGRITDFVRDETKLPLRDNHYDNNAENTLRHVHHPRISGDNLLTRILKNIYDFITNEEISFFPGTMEEASICVLAMSMSEMSAMGLFTGLESLKYAIGRIETRFPVNRRLPEMLDLLNSMPHLYGENSTQFIMGRSSLIALFNSDTNSSTLSVNCAEQAPEEVFAANMHSLDLIVTEEFCEWGTFDDTNIFETSPTNIRENSHWLPLNSTPEIHGNADIDSIKVVDLNQYIIPEIRDDLHSQPYQNVTPDILEGGVFSRLEKVEVPVGDTLDTSWFDELVDHKHSSSTNRILSLINDSKNEDSQNEDSSHLDIEENEQPFLSGLQNTSNSASSNFPEQSPSNRTPVVEGCISFSRETDIGEPVKNNLWGINSDYEDDLQYLTPDGSDILNNDSPLRSRESKEIDIGQGTTTNKETFLICNKVQNKNTDDSLMLSRQNNADGNGCEMRQNANENGILESKHDNSWFDD